MNNERKEKYVHEVFDTIAGKYDFMNLLMTWGMLPMWQKLVMKKTELGPGGRALDVCCGTGEMTYQEAAIVGNFGHAVGLDFSENMLTAAKAKMADHPDLHVQFVQGDALALPFPDDSFDAATSGFALRNVSDIPLAIRGQASRQRVPFLTSIISRSCHGSAATLSAVRPSPMASRLIPGWQRACAPSRHARRSRRCSATPVSPVLRCVRSVLGPLPFTAA